MKQCMLDTNICIYAVKNNPQVLDKLAEHLEDELCISSIVKSDLQDIAVLPYDKKAAKEYGKIRADLERQGTPIGGNDLLIAAHCKFRS